MLTYHPAFDFYHSAYRILLLLNKTTRNAVEVDRMRIWDFYFVFPKAIKDVVMPRDLWSFKNIPDDGNPYEEIVDPQRIFSRMEPYQASAFRYLAAYGLIDSDRLAENEIKRSAKRIPAALLTNMRELDPQQEHVIKLISGPFSGLPLYGPSGLKARTKLLDFKYDPR
jgi:hypothetical protein